MNSIVAKRNPYWDSLKFVLVFGVVLAHCVASYRPAGGINQPFYNFLGTFLMPTFIFVSGMFSQVKDREKYKKGILRIFETYVVLQTIKVGMTVIPALIHGTATPKSIIVTILNPQFGSWYLLSLTFWRLMVFWLPEKFLRDNPVIIVSACIIISLLGGFIPVGKTLSLQRTMTFLPFFFMGFYAKNIEMKKYIAKIPLPLAIGVLFSAFLIYYQWINYDISFIWYGWRAYLPIAGFSSFELFVARVIFLISTSITGLMVMRLIPTKATFFSEWGRITLFIYAYHLFIINILRYAIKHGLFPQSEWPLYILPVFITLGLVVISRVQLFNILLNPVSYCVQRFKAKSGGGNN